MLTRFKSFLYSFQSAKKLFHTLLEVRQNLQDMARKDFYPLRNTVLQGIVSASELATAVVTASATVITTATAAAKKKDYDDNPAAIVATEAAV